MELLTSRLCKFVIRKAVISFQLLKGILQYFKYGHYYITEQAVSSDSASDLYLEAAQFEFLPF